MHQRRAGDIQAGDREVEVLVHSQDQGTYTLTTSQDALIEFCEKRGYQTGDTLQMFLDAFPTLIEVGDRIYESAGRPKRVTVGKGDLDA